MYQRPSPSAPWMTWGSAQLSTRPSPGMTGRSGLRYVPVAPRTGVAATISAIATVRSAIGTDTNDRRPTRRGTARTTEFLLALRGGTTAGAFLMTVWAGSWHRLRLVGRALDDGLRALEDQPIDPHRA